MNDFFLHIKTAEVGTPCDFKLLVLESVLFQRASNKESLQCEAQLEHSSPKPDLENIMSPRTAWDKCNLNDITKISEY